MSSDKNHVKPLVAFGATSAILAARAATIRHFGNKFGNSLNPKPANGFRPSLLSLGMKTGRTAFLAAPPLIKAATVISLVAGMTATRPLNAFKHGSELLRQKTHNFWK